MNKKRLALYGLKWNPFAPGVPVEALHVTARVELFCWRVRQLVGEGGFALVTGVPGTGKSAALRVLAASLAAQRDVKLGVISRPQANIADFYREMGDLFGVELQPHNRWAGAKVLRQRWQAYIDATLSRPVLIVGRTRRRKSSPPSSQSCACCPPPNSIRASCSPSCSPAMAASPTACVPTSSSPSTAACACA